RGRGPIHRRLLLLEADRRLMQRRCPEGPALAQAAARRPPSQGAGGRWSWRWRWTPSAGRTLQATRSACWATTAWSLSQGQPNGVVKYLIGKRAWIFGPRVQLELAGHATRMTPHLAHRAVLPEKVPMHSIAVPTDPQRADAGVTGATTPPIGRYRRVPVQVHQADPDAPEVARRL